MNNIFFKVIFLLLAISVIQGNELGLTQPPIFHPHYFQFDADSSHSVFSGSADRQIQPDLSTGQFFLAAYGYNEHGGTEGFEGQSWDFFTMHQTSAGASFLKAANNAHLRRLHLYTTKGNQKQSLSEINYLLIRVPNHPRVLLMAEVVEKLFKQKDFALKAYKEALNLYPQHALTHAQYGRYLSKIGKRGEGINRLKQAIKIDPKLAISYAWLSEAYYLAGQKDAAESSGKLARKLGYKGKIAKP